MRKATNAKPSRAESTVVGSGDWAATLRDKITERKAKVGVIGLGYVGLPLAFEIAKAGYRTLGVEENAERCASVNEGKNYIQDIKGEANLVFKRLVRDGVLSATRGFKEMVDADIIVICVPTPLNKNKEPDVSYIEAAVSGIRDNFGPGKLVILESTTYPGTTEELIQPVLEKLGHVIGKDFFLAFSPERIDPGNREYSTKNTTKIVGGVTPACLDLAWLFYSNVITKLVKVSSPRVAEMAKVFENVYRSVNIALVNELAVLCDRMNINVYEVISAADTKPYGFQAFWPGPGVGGHCIPLDPYYLAWKGKEYDLHARFIELASEINESMPRFIVSKAADVLNRRSKALRGSKVIQLGVAYKNDIDDYRESPALKIYDLLIAAGADVTVWDPFVPKFSVHEHATAGKPVEWINTKEVSEKDIRNADLVLIVTGHSNFPYEMIVKAAPAIFDTRNVLGFRGISAPNIIHLSMPVHLFATK